MVARLALAPVLSGAIAVLRFRESGWHDIAVMVCESRWSWTSSREHDRVGMKCAPYYGMAASTITHTPLFDKKTGERQGAPYYELTAPNGRTTYLGLGTFASGMAAADAWRSKTRSGSGVALIRECRDAIRFELTYGLHTAIVATAIAPTWQ